MPRCDGHRYLPGDFDLQLDPVSAQVAAPVRPAVPGNINNTVNLPVRRQRHLHSACAIWQRRQAR